VIGGGDGGYRYAHAPVTIATAIALIAVGAILRYAINVDSETVSIPTIGLILMIAGFAGLALSLLYELIRNRPNESKDEYAGRDPYEDRTRRMR
jgi:hypothetical protein